MQKIIELNVKEVDDYMRPTFIVSGTIGPHGIRTSDKTFSKKRCEYPGCPTHPTYGLLGSKKREYCAKHGKDREGYEDISNKRCEYPGCPTHPTYGLLGLLIWL